MYSKSDEVIQQRFDQVEKIERIVESSTEYLDTELKIGLVRKELLSFVSVKEQKSAIDLINRMEEYYIELYNHMMYAVVSSVEFKKVDD